MVDCRMSNVCNEKRSPLSIESLSSRDPSKEMDPAAPAAMSFFSRGRLCISQIALLIGQLSRYATLQGQGPQSVMDCALPTNLLKLNASLSRETTKAAAATVRQVKDSVGMWLGLTFGAPSIIHRLRSGIMSKDIGSPPARNISPTSQQSAHGFVRQLRLCFKRSTTVALVGAGSGSVHSSGCIVKWRCGSSRRYGPTFRGLE
jgi:hypothetical protein